MGKHEESCNVTIPLDIIELIARRYDMKEEELIRIYTKGVLDSIKEVNGDGSNGVKLRNLIQSQRTDSMI